MIALPKIAFSLFQNGFHRPPWFLKLQIHTYNEHTMAWAVAQRPFKCVDSPSSHPTPKMLRFTVLSTNNNPNLPTVSRSMVCILSSIIFALRPVTEMTAIHFVLTRVDSYMVQNNQQLSHDCFYRPALDRHFLPVETHGADPDSPHGVPVSIMVPLQHSSAPPGRLLHLDPPHVPHWLEQQTPLPWMPGIPLSQKLSSTSNFFGVEQVMIGTLTLHCSILSRRALLQHCAKK